MANERIPIYTVDAFTDEPFHGNPAAVCLIPRRTTITDRTMQAIAAEMNLSDTAFIEHQTEDGSFETDSAFKLRWFTPTCEVPLCGHATLASAAVLVFASGNKSTVIRFSTKSGSLTARRNGEMITLDFPLNATQKIDRLEVHSVLEKVCDDSLIKDVAYSPTTKNLLVRLKDELTRMHLEKIQVDTKALEQSEQTGKVRGVTLTLRGSETNMCCDHTGNMYDFVSRYFVPWVGIPEDPVTGSAHTVLVDYWRKHLEKTVFRAYQCSKRGGEVLCSIRDDRVELTGNTRIILKGELCV